MNDLCSVEVDQCASLVTNDLFFFCHLKSKYKGENRVNWSYLGDICIK